MGRRAPERLVPDWHLWGEVTRTIDPLRPPKRVLAAPIAETPLPLPQPVMAPKPAKTVIRPTAPAFRPDGIPARPQTPPGTVIEPRLLRRVERGRIGIDARIDLHGLRQAEAHAALTRFIAARARRGDRTVLVITGKGRSGPDADAFGFLLDKGILRTMLPLWLAEPGLAPLVAGWEQAARGHGGRGALYVRLRTPPPARLA